MPSIVTAGPTMLAMVCCCRHNCDQRTVGCEDVWRFPSWVGRFVCDVFSGHMVTKRMLQDATVVVFCTKHPQLGTTQRETHGHPFSASCSSTNCREAPKWLLYICF